MRRNALLVLAATALLVGGCKSVCPFCLETEPGIVELVLALLAR